MQADLSTQIIKSSLYESVYNLIDIGSKIDIPLLSINIIQGIIQIVI